MTNQRRIKHRVPFDLLNINGRQDAGVKELGVVVLPVVLTKSELGRVFGKSVSWVDAYLTKEGQALSRHERVVNGRKMWLTKGVLDFIDGLV
jgi:hypothetical protein